MPKPRFHRGISRITSIVAVIIVIAILLVAGYVALNKSTTSTTQSTSSTSFASTSSSATSSTISSSSLVSATSSSSSIRSTTSSSSSSSSSTSSSSSSTTSSAPVPSTFTYEQTQTYSNLDPQVQSYTYDAFVIQNIYETLLEQNGTSSSLTIPWLAQNYTVYDNGYKANFTLRQGITFADGEPLNSTAVYFSFNRLFAIDGGQYTSLGTGSAYIMEVLENTSLSYALSGPHPYNQAWLNEVLAQDFVQITGTYTFTLNIVNPNAALQYLLANGGVGQIVAPDYVMQHDIALWSQPSLGYKLPYPTLSGNSTQEMNEYFSDVINTCEQGATPSGCGLTYLDNSLQGSMAGTGPYVIQSVDQSSNTITLTARSNYWGGAYPSKIGAQIPTVVLKYVPSLATRELDLQNAVSSGQAMAIDLPATNLYDVASRTAWLQNNTLTSIVPGVSVYGPEPALDTEFNMFVLNVTNPYTGLLQTFQPFADSRIRLAFADSVNLSEVNIDDNNKLGLVAQNVVPPGINPPQTYNTSIAPTYSYNPDESAQLLLQAMEHPLTQFTFYNGTAAPPGYFNNTFGCPTLNSNDQCSNPVSQMINAYVVAGDTVDIAQLTEIAQNINNISSTYNMGLTVAVVPVPTSALFAQSGMRSYYFYNLGWFGGPSWVTTYLAPMLATSLVAGLNGWNITQLTNLNNQAEEDTVTNNLTGLVQVSNLMNQIANNMVMYQWTFNEEDILVMTSNVHGFIYNPSLQTNVAGDALELLYTLY